MKMQVINKDYRDVDWVSRPDVDRGFTDIPFEVYDMAGYHQPYAGQRGSVEEYDDTEFDYGAFMDCQREALADNGLSLVCHSPQQTEQVIEAARSAGFRAGYGDIITLYFVQEGPEATPPLWTKRKLAQNKYSVSLLMGPDHEFDHEYVRNAIPYPRTSTGIDWHPCPLRPEPLRALMDGFGGETWIDFCAGTGTTGIVAKELDLDVILVEKEERYIEPMEDRIMSHKVSQDAMEW